METDGEDEETHESDELGPTVDLHERRPPGPQGNAPYLTDGQHRPHAEAGAEADDEGEPQEGGDLAERLLRT